MIEYKYVPVGDPDISTVELEIDGKYFSKQRKQPCGPLVCGRADLVVHFFIHDRDARSWHSTIVLYPADMRRPYRT